MFFRSGETGSADVGDAMAARFGKIFLQRFGVAQRIEFLAEDGHGACGPRSMSACSISGPPRLRLVRLGASVRRAEAALKEEGLDGNPLERLAPGVEVVLRIWRRFSRFSKYLAIS